MKPHEILREAGSIIENQWIMVIPSIDGVSVDISDELAAMMREDAEYLLANVWHAPNPHVLSIAEKITGKKAES